MKLNYRLDYSDEMPGGDRVYDVLRLGRVVGTVSKDWAPAATEGGNPVRCWWAELYDGRRAEAPTRDAAVKAAFAKDVPAKEVK